MYSKEHILSEINRTAEENRGKPLGLHKFEEETGIKKYDWFPRYWIRWGDAVEEAGYTPNKMRSAYDKDYMLQRLIELIKELNAFPVSGQFRLKGLADKTFPNEKTFRTHFGPKSELTQAVLRFCETHNADDSVIELCRAASKRSVPRQPREPSEEQIEHGFVYLMKSGTKFKIGRSSSAERREYELKIQVPDKLELLHKIKTDDPVGIERYWHERFKDKRKRGEWFDLSSNDLKAFRRRKFM